MSIDNLGPLGISDSHMISTFATKPKVKAAAILFAVCLQSSAIINLSSCGASYFVNGASCLGASFMLGEFYVGASCPEPSRKTLDEHSFVNYNESLLHL